MNSVRCAFRSVALAIAAISLGGCSSDDGPSVESQSAVLTEELRIDAYEHDLVPISRIAVAENGVMALIQPQDALVRFFSPEGAPIGEVGGNGQGPGEFTSMSAVGWLADTLWVYDARQTRFTLIAPDLTFIRNVGMTRGAQPAAPDVGRIPAFLGSSPRGLLGNGDVVALLEVPADGDLPDGYADQAALARLDATGMIQQVIQLISTAGLQITTPVVSMGMPFANVPRIEVSPDGRRTAVAIANLEGPNAGTFTLRVVESTGDTVFARDYPFDPDPLPRQVTDSVVQMMVQEFGPRAPGLADAIREQVRPPSIYPPLVGVVIGRDGRTLVQMIDDDDTRTYRVIAAEGEPIGDLTMGTNSRVAAADGDRVWVIERDSLDVESVVRYGVQWE